MLRDKEDSGLPCGRTGKRDSFFLLAMLCDEDGGEIAPARIRNLSATGMKADCSAPLIAGVRLTFAIGGVGDVSGVVVRIDGGQIAVRFDKEIDPLKARRRVSGKPAGIVKKPKLSVRR